MAHMFFVTVRITAGTPMEETALKFVHGVRGEIEAVHQELGTGDAILPGIACVLDVLGLSVITPG